MSLLIILFVIVLFFFWKYWSSKSRVKKPYTFPGGLPIIGHAHMLLGDTTQLYQLMDSLSKCSLENDGVILFKIGWQNHYVITDPEDFATVSNQCLKKHFAYDFLKPWLGDSLVTGSDIDLWKRHRRILNPAFSQQNTDGFLGIINHQARGLVNSLAKHAGKDEFSHIPYFQKTALENISQSAFGIDVDNYGIFDRNKYATNVNNMLIIITERFQKVWMHSPALYKLTYSKKREDKIVEYFNKTCDELLKIKQDNYLNGDYTKEPRNKAFIDLIVELSANGKLKNEEILGIMNTVVVAGYDSSYITLTFAMILLGSHPEVQEKVYDELRGVFGESDRDVTAEDISKLTYLTAVIKETLRYFSTIPLLLRYVDKDVQLRNCIMPAGSHCILLVSGLHRHPVWGADVNEFKPERWLDPNVQFDNPKSIMNKAFAGFAWGKRVCLGKLYAMTSMKATLAHILRHYKITADHTKLKLKIDPNLKPCSGHLIRLERRTILK